MTDRVRRIAAAIAIEGARAHRIGVCGASRPHHGLQSRVSVETGARVRTILVNGMDLYRVSCDYP
jgi:hypothetical protein